STRASETVPPRRRVTAATGSATTCAAARAWSACSTDSGSAGRGASAPRRSSASATNSPPKATQRVKTTPVRTNHGKSLARNEVSITAALEGRFVEQNANGVVLYRARQWYHRREK